MKQTPMQELIDDLQHTADNFKINNEKDKAVHVSLIVTIGIAQSLLEKEKDVMCEFAFRFNHDAFNENYIKAEFEETFNNK